MAHQRYIIGFSTPPTPQPKRDVVVMSYPMDNDMEEWCFPLHLHHFFTSITTLHPNHSVIHKHHKQSETHSPHCLWVPLFYQMLHIYFLRFSFGWKDVCLLVRPNCRWVHWNRHPPPTSTNLNRFNNPWSKSTNLSWFNNCWSTSTIYIYILYY